MAVSVFLSPLVIILSLLKDLIVLNVNLLRAEKFFEYKYPKTENFEG